jgi:hypothetical protein
MMCLQFTGRSQKRAALCRVLHLAFSAGLSLVCCKQGLDYCNLIAMSGEHRCWSLNAPQREFVTSNDKPRIVAYRYIIEASIDVS